jgi:hypothetical protein
MRTDLANNQICPGQMNFRVSVANFRAYGRYCPHVSCPITCEQLSSENNCLESFVVCIALKILLASVLDDDIARGIS